MTQLIDLKSIWFKTKLALYAAMIIIVAMAIPVLSYIELSHKEPLEEKSKKISTYGSAKQLTVDYPGQS